MLQGMADAASTQVDTRLLLWNAGLQADVAWGWCAVLGASAAA